jgi:hypothetical protein
MATSFAKRVVYFYHTAGGCQMPESGSGVLGIEAAPASGGNRETVAVGFRRKITDIDLTLFLCGDVLNRERGRLGTSVELKEDHSLTLQW